MKRAGLIAGSVGLLIVLALPGTVVSAESFGRDMKVVYHLDDARNGRFALHIAADHLAINPDIRIAVVAYAAGVDFLVAGATDRKGEAYAPAVEALRAKGVEFRVCSTTLRLRDIRPEQLLEGMQLVPSGTFEVIRLQAEEGYVYLKP